MRALLVLFGTVAFISGLIWLGNRVAASPAPRTSPAQAAAAASVDRKYHALVRRLKVSARRALRIRAARGAWERQANRICGSDLREVRAAIAAAGSVRTRSELVSLFSKVDTIEEDHVAQLRALTPPRHDAPRVERMLELSAEALATDRAAIAAFGRNDRRSFLRALRHELRLGQRLDAIAAALGADVCTENPFSVDG